MSTYTRFEGRSSNKLRSWKITRGVLDYAEGSALIETGRTKVICSASIAETVPSFLKDSGSGWITAEYSMLPRSTHTRSARERGPRLGGRTMEIQRLIGRSLRSIADLTKLGERTITIDCDVIQADGGTRTAAISGGWVALKQAVDNLISTGLITADPLLDSVAAISVGIVGDDPLLDLDYSEDSTADVDMNVVMTGSGHLVEVQATAERSPFSLERLNELIHMAHDGIQEIRTVQLNALK